MMFWFSEQPVLASFALSLAINLFFFTVALTLRTDKVTDFSYSLSFVVMAPLLLLSRGKAFSVQQLLTTLAIVLWGLRLGSYLFMRILKTGRDERFDDKRNNPGRLAGFWTLQTVAVWMIMLPFSFYLTRRSAEVSSIVSIAGFTVYSIGMVLESVSDYQKYSFKRQSGNRDHWMDRGLWAYSRHPNYFGEMLVWWGLFAVTLPYLSGIQYVSVMGPVFITLLLLFVSGIPLLEKSAEKKYGQNPDYRRYRDSTSLLIPLPRKK